MSTILVKKVKYETRGSVSSLDYYFRVRLDDIETLGPLIKYLVETAVGHLLINNILKYKLSMLINTAYITAFGINYTDIHDYNAIEVRLVKYSQSAKSLLGKDRHIEFIIKALTWDSA